MTHVVEAHEASGRRYELARISDTRLSAVGVAVRVAGLLSRIGNPRRWGGSKVVARQVSSGAIVFAARISPARRAAATREGGGR